VLLLRTAGSVLWLICRVVAGAEDESEAGDEPKSDQPSILLAQSGWVPNPGKARPRGRRLRRQGLDRGLAPSPHCHQEFDGGVRLIAGLTCRVISRRHVLNGPSFRQPSTLRPRSASGESVAVGSLGDVAGSGKGCEAVIERGGAGAAVCPQFRE
jgi:hypothetical protein